MPQWDDILRPQSKKGSSVAKFKPRLTLRVSSGRALAQVYEIQVPVSPTGEDVDACYEAINKLWHILEKMGLCELEKPAEEVETKECTDPADEDTTSGDAP